MRTGQSKCYLLWNVDLWNDEVLKSKELLWGTHFPGAGQEIFELRMAKQLDGLPDAGTFTGD
jgi:hypothetical protein